MERPFETERKILSGLAKEVYENAQKNRIELQKVFDPVDEFDKFFMGNLSRQVHLLADIHCLLKYNFHHFLSGIFIIGRSLLDDYIQLHYVCNSVNPSKEIVSLNAAAHGYNFRKTLELAKINEELFEDKFPHYPTKETIEFLENVYRTKPEKRKYIKDIDKFKFHSFPTKRDIIESYKGSAISPDMGRIYFLWKHLSDYIHFSKFTYDFEFNHHKDPANYKTLEEVILYAYKASKLSVKHFENRYGFASNSVEYYETVNVEYLQNYKNL